VPSSPLIETHHIATVCIRVITIASVKVTPHPTNDAVMVKGKRLVTWSIRVDDDLDAVVRRLAEKDLRTVSNYVEMVVRKHIADQGIEVGKPAPEKPEKPAKGGKR
jgi:hypothetical protein